VNDENAPLMFSPATQLACCRIASWEGEAAGESPAFAGGSEGAPPAAGALAVAEALAVGAAVPLDVGVGAPDADDVAGADGEPDADGDGWW
jgi:hypothetical protein